MKADPKEWDHCWRISHPMINLWRKQEKLYEMKADPKKRISIDSSYGVEPSKRNKSLFLSNYLAQYRAVSFLLYIDQMSLAISHFSNNQSDIIMIGIV